MARNIQVVLTDDLPNVGKSGDLVRVRPGYARNFLMPRGLAAMATKDNVSRIEHEKRVATTRAAKLRVENQKLAEVLGAVRLTIPCAAGEGNKLYGSITSRDVEEALAAKGHVIDRRKIVLEPIKEVGVYAVPIRIGAGVDAQIHVEVVAKS